MCVDLLEQRLAQTVLLQQMAEVQDRRLVGQRSRQPQPDKPPHRLHLVEQVLHAGVAQVVEQLHAVHAQHHRERVWPPTPTGLRIERLDARLQPAPRDQRVHLLKEHLAPRPPLLRGVFQLREGRLFHRTHHLVTNLVNHRRTDLFRPSLRIRSSDSVSTRQHSTSLSRVTDAYAGIIWPWGTSWSSAGWTSW